MVKKKVSWVKPFLKFVGMVFLVLNIGIFMSWYASTLMSWLYS